MAVAPARGGGLGAWRPAVPRKLGRRESCAGEGRGVTSDLSASTDTDKTGEGDFAWPCRPPATTELVLRTRSQQLELQPPPELGWVPWQSGFFHRPPGPPEARATAPLDTRTHTPSPITDAHTLASGATQASALGTRAKECRDTFRRLIGSRRQPLTPPSPGPATIRPGVPVPTARESPGCHELSSLALAKSNAASPRPAARAGKRNRESAGTQGARGAAIYRRAAASEIQGAKV